jgi:hypothetical protein
MDDEEDVFVEPMRAKRIRKRLAKVRRARNKHLETIWWFNTTMQPQHRLAEAEMFGRYNADNMTPCSCDACCNPRHSGYSSGKHRHTLQERRNGFYKKHKNVIARNVGIISSNLLKKYASLLFIVLKGFVKYNFFRFCYERVFCLNCVI